MKKILLGVILSLPVFVQASESMYLQAGIGVGQVNVTPDYQMNSYYEENDTINFQGFVGKKFQHNLRADMGLMMHSGVDIFGIADSSSLFEAMMQLGYVIIESDTMKVIPKIGYTFWDLDSSEGQFLNPGPEAESSLSGNNMNYSLTVNVRKLYFSYQTGDYEFGPVNSYMVGLGIDL